MTKRIEWLDVLKGIGIIFIVLGHLTFYGNNDWLTVLIFSFHVPLFFVLSGYVYRISESFNEFLYKKFNSLLLPFLICSIADLFLEITKSVIKHEKIGLEVLRYLFFVDGRAALDTPIWFLFILFVIEIIYYFMFNKKLVNKIILCCASMILSAFINQRYYFGIGLIPISIAFLIIGDICKNERIKIIIKKLIKFWWIILPIWIISSIFNNQVDVYACWHGKSVILMYINAFLGIAFFTYLAMKLQKIGFLKYYGRNSIIVLCSHVYFTNFITGNIYNILRNYGILNNMTICLICVFVIAIMCTVIQITNTVITKLRNGGG